MSTICVPFACSLLSDNCWVFFVSGRCHAAGLDLTVAEIGHFLCRHRWRMVCGGMIVVLFLIAVRLLGHNDKYICTYVRVTFFRVFVNSAMVCNDLQRFAMALQGRGHSSNGSCNGGVTFATVLQWQSQLCHTFCTGGVRSVMILQWWNRLATFLGTESSPSTNQ